MPKPCRSMTDIWRKLDICFRYMVLLKVGILLNSLKTAMPDLESYVTDLVLKTKANQNMKK